MRQAKTTNFDGTEHLYNKLKVLANSAETDSCETDFCSSLHADLKENPATESCIYAKLYVIPACNTVPAMADSNSRG
jgi:hypothetical protein